VRGKITWSKTFHPNVYYLTEWEIDPARSVLLVLDMQRAYVDPVQGVGKLLKLHYPDIYQYFYRRLEKAVLPNILKLRDFFRQHRLEVFYTRIGLQLPDGEDLAAWSWRYALAHYQRDEQRLLYNKNSPEYEIIEELKPSPEELVLDKNSLNPFYSTGLSQILKSMQLENILITGALTNASVESTARTAGDRGYNTIVVEDACATYHQDEHESALRFPPNSSYVVKKTEEIIYEFSPLL